MYVIHEFNRRVRDKRELIRGIVSVLEGGIFYLGYFNREPDTVTVHSLSGDCYYAKNFDIIKDYVIFSKKCGHYLLTKDVPEKVLLEHQIIMGQYNANGNGGNFPYSFNREYEAVFNFDMFHNRQYIVGEEKEYPLTEYLKYSFGWEFETSMGYIPEPLCFRDGLIPLRDGSIKGIEYSTVVLQGNKGLNLLKQQTDTLKEYCAFNKECSLHVHMGGYPVDPKAIWVLYVVLKKVEEPLRRILPPLTFNSGKYKESGKDYCKFLPGFSNFCDMYESFVNTRYFGSLTEGHPSDPDRRHKWNVESRYYWANFINLLCYDSPKTIEFRFLRPSFNFEKIVNWLAVFNALLIFSENYWSTHRRTSDENIMRELFSSKVLTLSEILKSVYPNEYAEAIDLFLVKCSLVMSNQVANGDDCGSQFYLEDSCI